MQRFSDEFVFEVLRADEFSEQEETSADLILIFGMSGTAEIQIGEAKNDFKIDDIVCVNQGIPFRFLRASKNAIIAQARYSPRFLAQVLSESHPFFFCNSSAIQDTSYSSLKNIFYSLIYQYIYKRHSTQCYTKSLLLQLLDELLENFRVDKTGDAFRPNDDDERLRQMIIAVNTSFQYDTSLHPLARKMNTSASTLSRLFKKKTGLYFADYVSSVRAKHALNALLNTDASLTQIALDSGFANSSVFNTVFKRIYGKTPSAIRSEITEKAQKNDEAEIRNSLLETGLFSMNDNGDESFLSVSISENTEGERFKKFWNTTINMGPLYALTLADVQSHILLLQEQLGFQTVRVWNIFSRRLMIGGGEAGFNFDKINQVLDFLVEHHLRVFLDLGRRPDMAMSADKTVFFQNECIEFARKSDWEDFIRSFMRNATLRYGAKEVSSWLFDITRNSGHTEETPYWNESDYCFFDAYKITRKIIKSFCPEAKVGGISGMIEDDAAFLFSFYLSCKEENCVPDFLSFILFPYELNDRERAQSADSELKQVDFIRTVREKAGLTAIPIFITEWNNCISNRNLLNDSSYRASYIVHTILILWQKVDMLALLMGSDLVSSFEDSIGLVNGGIGLLTKNAIKKPAYHAFYFMRQLPETLIARKKQYIVCKKQKNSFYILCLNYKWFNRRYFMQSEDVAKDTDFSALNENNKNLRLHIAFTDTELSDDKAFRIKKRVVNETSGSILDEWKKLQFTSELSVQDVAYLSAMSTPRLSLETIESKNGVIEFDIVMQAQEIALLECECNK